MKCTFTLRDSATINKHGDKTEPCNPILHPPLLVFLDRAWPFDQRKPGPFGPSQPLADLREIFHDGVRSSWMNLVWTHPRMKIAPNNKRGAWRKWEQMQRRTRATKIYTNNFFVFLQKAIISFEKNILHVGSVQEEVCLLNFVEKALMALPVTPSRFAMGDL